MIPITSQGSRFYVQQQVWWTHWPLVCPYRIAISIPAFAYIASLVNCCTYAGCCCLVCAVCALQQALL
jgi:hypothetical protein